MKKIIILFVLLLGSAMAVRAAGAQENWEKNCAACHGKDGKGGTKAGRMVGVKDFTDAAYQKSFTDDKAFNQIKEGLKDEKGKEKMKPFKDDLNDEEAHALVAYVRAFQK